MPVYCPVAITFLLAMMRAIMNSKVVAQQTDLSVNYPNALVQFFFYVYINLPDYRAVFMSTDVLNVMVASSSRIPSPTRPSSSARTACSRL